MGRSRAAGRVRDFVRVELHLKTFDEWVRQFEGWWASQKDNELKPMAEVLYRAARDGWNGAMAEAEPIIASAKWTLNDLAYKAPELLGQEGFVYARLEPLRRAVLGVPLSDHPQDMAQLAFNVAEAYITFRKAVPHIGGFADSHAQALHEAADAYEAAKKK